MGNKIKNYPLLLLFKTIFWRIRYFLTTQNTKDRPKPLYKKKLGAGVGLRGGGGGWGGLGGERELDY